jgi:hypothetical protein
MSLVRCTAAAFAGMAIAAAPLAAQNHNRALIVGVYGGGYTHVNNVNATGQADAHFRRGYNLGLTGGVEISKLVSVHADFTYARAQGLGAWSLDGVDVDRYFYGAHVELGYPLAAGLEGYAFAGGGAVTIDPLKNATFGSFTTGAGMGGLGMFYTIPRSDLMVMLEGKSLVYRWDRGGFNRTLWDVTYSVGLAYRMPVMF